MPRSCAWPERSGNGSSGSASTGRWRSSSGIGDVRLIVIDASAAVELILRPQANEDARRQLLGETVQVPAHFDAEVLAAILRELRRGLLETARAEIALLKAVRLPAQRVALEGMVAEAYTLRDRVRAYDAFYVVLARRASAVLLTNDAPLSRAAGDLVEVRLLS